ncbi:hypothetical protein ACJJTC_016335, partial [Scirpophaga incertulas]
MAKEETTNPVVVEETSGAVNPTILDYYKKFGRNRDLEQYFSLSTANNEVRDVTSLFWRRMKSQDTSDSCEKNSESSTELCRISIKCSVPDKSEDENTKTKSDSESPPIITDHVEPEPKIADGDSCNEDNESQKSIDVILDTSNNKPLSPTSSITSQRKLEWDSLADVGYENETDRKNSASSLSTLERLALKQQYSNNDSKDISYIGLPTAHSTQIDYDIKSSNKIKDVRKTTRIYKKDIEVVEVNVPHILESNTSHSFNVNLSKHLSFKMDKDGGITVGNTSSDINISPEKCSSDKEVQYLKTDKEIQTSLIKTAEKSIDSKSPPHLCNNQNTPVMISLNTLKKRYRRKKSMTVRKKFKKCMKYGFDKENIPIQEKSNEQLSAAESFEYMPGHIYNQNQMNFEKSDHNDNKSSLESSGGLTTQSNNSSKHSFSKDFEKGFELLKSALHKKSSDSELKKKLIKEVVQRLLKSKYHDDDSTTDFLSGLSFNSKRLGLGQIQMNSSTSDSNNTEPNLKFSKPRKSILRLDKFNSNVIATTSQSAPNLPTVANCEKPIIKALSSNTDSDISSREKHSSDTVFAKNSSEKLYQKYLEALKREESYKRHLKEKETFLKQKLVCSETALKPPKSMKQVDNDLKNLLYDLTRNNYNDGSGDAPKLESNKSYLNGSPYDAVQKQRSHSVFTLSSCKSDENCKRNNLKKKLQCEVNNSKVSNTKDNHQCRCPHHNTLPKVTDSTVQVNMNENLPEKHCERHKITCNCNEGNSSTHLKQTAVLGNDLIGDMKYVCVCHQKPIQEPPDNILIYKCSQLSNILVQNEDLISKLGNVTGFRCTCKIQENNATSSLKSSTSKRDDGKLSNFDAVTNIASVFPFEMTSKSSQTNIALPILNLDPSMKHLNKSLQKSDTSESSSKMIPSKNEKNLIPSREITRYIQTEVSIDPKISDPSLTDINIINDDSCNQLISEEYRHNNIQSVSKMINTNQGITSFESVTHKDFDKELHNNATKIVLPKEGNYCSENFTIPIQGTNMALMVKIGSHSETTSGNKMLRTFDTKNKMTFEKTTSLMEECSKGTQSADTDVFSSIIKESKLNKTCDKVEQFVIEEDKNINYCSHKSEVSPKSDRSRNIAPSFADSIPIPQSNTLSEDLNDKLTKDIVNPQNVSTINDGQQYTYPRSLKPDPKRFLRSNTDTGKFFSVSSVQTEAINKVDAVTQETLSHESDKDESNKLITPHISSNSSNIIDSDSKDCSLNTRTGHSNIEYDKDLVLDSIKNITKRYYKKDIEKNKRKKCFKEIMTLFSYLLDTDDTTDHGDIKLTGSSNKLDTESISSKIEDRAAQSPGKKVNNHDNFTESSEIQMTTDFPTTSTDSATYKVLDKIKKECERYQQKRCKGHTSKKCEVSSSNSVNCNHCTQVHYCSCRGHRCNRLKLSADKTNKKCIAYNLIIQTSDSVVSEETDVKNKPLRNIVVKIPNKRVQIEKLPFKEVTAKIEKKLSGSLIIEKNTKPSRNWPNDTDISSNDEYNMKNKGYSVREYLETNRPDFVEKISKRQQCLKHISEQRAIHDAAKRQLLSMQLAGRPALTSLSETEIHRLAKDLGIELRRKNLAPKFISEREMKKHSEKIYKSLPEVVQKKEKARKENIKRTNLLMANIFKK